MAKGHSKEAIAANIRELIDAGHEPKDAVAAALSSARKYKKMAAGGMVDIDDDSGLGTNDAEDAQRSQFEIQAQGMSHPAKVANPEEEEFSDHLARALYKKSEREGMMSFAEGGLVEEEYSDEPMGNKPSEDMESSSEEPMSSEPVKPMAPKRDVSMSNELGLSEDAKRAIEMRKSKRRFA